MKQYCLWKDNEVKKLFGFIENYTKDGKSLSLAFKDYAVKNKRKPNSVRNYYYLELNHLLENKARANSLGINLNLHKKKQANFFTKEETEIQMQKLIELKNKGYSVRKACLTIANGNVENMVRLQNKYRTLMKKEPEYLERISGCKSNIIPMPQRKNKLSDNDINSLFVGLVRLIKSQAKQEANLAIKQEKEKANNLLRQTLVDLASKEKQLTSLRKQFELLKTESKILSENLENLRVENAKLMVNSKNEKFKKWAEKSSKKSKTANLS